MKKFARTLVIAVLCLMLAVPAFAEPKEYRTGIKDARLIVGTNRYTVTTANGTVMYDLDGNALTDDGYSGMTYASGYLGTYRYGVDEVNCYGLLDQQGNTVVPFKYNMVENNEYWAVGIELTEATADSYDFTNYSKDAFFNISSVGIYRLPEGECKAELTRDQYMDQHFFGRCINIADRSAGTVTTYDYDFNALGTVEDLFTEKLDPEAYTSYRENGRYGLQDAAGNVVLEPAYQSISPSRGYYLVYDGEKNGLLDENCKLVVDVKYDRIVAMDSLPAAGDSFLGYCALDNFYSVAENDKVGFVDAAGNVTFAPKYNRDNVTVHGASYTLQDLEGNIIICAADGTETTVTDYSYFNPLNYTSGIYFKVKQGEEVYGMVDWHGNEILPCEYIYISATGDGRYVMVSKDFNMFDILELEYPQFGTETPANNGSETADAPVAPAQDNSAAITLIDSAVELLGIDAAANGVAAASLLNTAAGMIGNADAAALISSAATLLSADAAANSAAATTLITTAMNLLN